MHPYRVRYRIIQHDQEEFGEPELKAFYGTWCHYAEGIPEGARVVFAKNSRDAVDQVKHNEQARLELSRSFYLAPGTCIYTTHVEAVSLLDYCDPAQPQSWVRLGCGSQELLNALDRQQLTPANVPGGPPTASPVAIARAAMELQEGSGWLCLHFNDDLGALWRVAVASATDLEWTVPDGYYVTQDDVEWFHSKVEEWRASRGAKEPEQ